MTRLIGRSAARELVEDRADSVAGEDVNGVTSETVGDVATHVLFRGVGVAVEDSAHHGLVFLLNAGPVGGGVLAGLERGAPVPVRLIP